MDEEEYSKGLKEIEYREELERQIEQNQLKRHEEENLRLQVERGRLDRIRVSLEEDYDRRRRLKGGAPREMKETMRHNREEMKRDLQFKFEQEDSYWLHNKHRSFAKQQAKFSPVIFNSREEAQTPARMTRRTAWREGDYELPAVVTRKGKVNLLERERLGHEQGVEQQIKKLNYQSELSRQIEDNRLRKEMDRINRQHQLQLEEIKLQAEQEKFRLKLQTDRQLQQQKRARQQQFEQRYASKVKELEEERVQLRRQQRIKTEASRKSNQYQESKSILFKPIPEAPSKNQSLRRSTLSQKMESEKSLEIVKPTASLPQDQQRISREISDLRSEIRRQNEFLFNQIRTLKVKAVEGKGRVERAKTLADVQPVVQEFAKQEQARTNEMHKLFKFSNLEDLVNHAQLDRGQGMNKILQDVGFQTRQQLKALLSL